MVTFGYLTYCKGKISIPYKELEEKFIKALNKDSEMEYYYDLIKISDEMLKCTLEKNTEKMCKILENGHLKKIKSGDKIDHYNLKHVIDFVYFKARETYNVDEEVKRGKDDLNFIFYPKDKMKPLIIIELKLNSTVKNALEQIYDKENYFGLKEKGYKGTYLFIGFNLNTKQKLYSCVINECDCDLNIISEYKYIPLKSKKRSANDVESDVIVKRLRSDNEKNTNTEGNR